MLRWENLKDSGVNFTKTYRAKVPGGWLIRVWQSEGQGITFYPDPNHTWDGNSLN